MYRFAVIFGVVVATSGVVRAVTPEDVMISGQQNIMIIDANDNGTLGDDGDCTFSATSNSGALEVTPSQSGSATNPLRVCQGTCDGFAFLDSDSFTAMITGCNWGALSPGGPFVPACMELASSVPDSSDSPCTASGAAGGAQGQTVLELKAGRLFYPGFEFIIAEPGFGFLCNAGGPAVEISTISGRRVVTNFTFIGESPRYACVKIPFELTDGSKKLLDACVPLNANGNIDYASGPDEPFAETPLTGLASCAGRDAAPTASDFGLVALGLALLGAGAWTLGRRRGFSASLPLL